MMGWIVEGLVGYQELELLLHNKVLILTQIIYQIWYDRFMHVHCMLITMHSIFMCIDQVLYIYHQIYPQYIYTLFYSQKNQ